MSKIWWNEEEIEGKFYNLSNRKKVDILENALANMQAANWQSRIRCIALAMGYENKLGGNADYVKIEDL
jgi:hypothetical protein